MKREMKSEQEKIKDELSACVASVLDEIEELRKKHKIKFLNWLKSPTVFRHLRYVYNKEGMKGIRKELKRKARLFRLI